VAPYAARFQDFDSELGGHKIPKNVTIIQMYMSFIIQGFKERLSQLSSYFI